jgi:hypothetical protein
MNVTLEPAPWYRGAPNESLLRGIQLIGDNIWKEAAEDFFADRLAKTAVGRSAPKGIQRYINQVLEDRFTSEGWAAHDGRFFWRNDVWIRVTFRHQMSLGADLMEALKVHRKERIAQVAIMAASHSFLSTISPNDAAALVSFEKLRTSVVDLEGVLDLPLFIGRLEPRSLLRPEVQAFLRKGRPRDLFRPGA